MHPPVFATLNASAAVKAVFGTAPLRVTPFGEAPATTPLPYATFQTITGTPTNTLSGAPKDDDFRIQFDVFAADATAARNGARVLRDALQTIGYIVSWNGELRDPTTKHYRYGFDWEHITPRV